MFIFSGFLELKSCIIHVNLACLNVIWAQNSHAASQRGFVQVSGILVLLIENQKLSHDSVDVDVQRMIGSPMVI